MEALSDIRLGYSRTLPAPVILERSALHGVKDLRTVGVKKSDFCYAQVTF